jgi:hypothetical protein
LVGPEGRVAKWVQVDDVVATTVVEESFVFGCTEEGPVVFACAKVAVKTDEYAVFVLAEEAHRRGRRGGADCYA